MVLEAEAEFQVAQGNPGGFTAPTCLHKFIVKWEQLFEGGTGFWRVLFL
jgi:hypothetical protein